MGMEPFDFFFGSLIGLLLFAISIVLYFLPTIIAIVRGK